MGQRALRRRKDGSDAAAPLTGEETVPRRQADDGVKVTGRHSAIDMLVTLLDHAITQGAILKLPKFVRLITLARQELVEDIPDFRSPEDRTED